MAASTLTQANEKSKMQNPGTPVHASEGRLAWSGVSALLGQKNRWVHEKLHQDSVSPTHLVYLNQSFVIKEKSWSPFSLKYHVYQKPVLPNVDLWLQISLHCCLHIAFSPLSRDEGTGGPFKCLFAFSPNLKIFPKYRSNGKLT